MPLRHALSLGFGRTSLCRGGLGRGWRLLPLCGPLAQHGSRTAVSDVGAAALAVRAAVPTALLNVEINLASIDDAAFAERARAQAAALVDGLDEQVAEVLATVRARIAG